MAMKTASPWWFSALLAAGLVLLFLGERAFSHIDTGRLLFSGVGLALIAGTTGLRAWTYAGTRGARRKVEKALLLCHAGVWVGLAGYLLTTSWGRDLIGIDSANPKTLARFQIPMTVLWSIVMAVSLVPVLMIELSLGTAMRTRFVPGDLQAGDTADEAVESFRVREMALSGITMALALGFLMVTCSVADQRNIRRDVSYFKTSSPGTATTNAVKAQSEGLTVLLFFPAVNEVKDEVRGYFEALRAAAGNVVIEEHDHRVQRELAEKYRVNKEGTIVLLKGDKHESITVEADTEKARSKARTQLREFDRKVNAAVMKLIRERRVAYLTVGHGELNDPDSKVVQSLGPQTGEIRKHLTDLNYQVKDLSLVQGLGSEVPEDADLVLVLGPELPLSDGELDALDAYLARGGKLLVALDPKGEFRLGKLEVRLGLTFVADPITTDNPREAYPLTRSPFDRRVIVTNKFSSHAAITTLTRGQARKGILFIESGSLDEIEPTVEPKPKRTHVIKSFESTWRDTKDPATGNENAAFDAAREKRGQYNLVAVVEGPAQHPPQDGDAAAEDGGDDEQKQKQQKNDAEMRVMVVADRDIFRDQVQELFAPTVELFSDAVKWLGGEEYIAGEVVSEKDVYIKHTQSEDVIWFYSTIVGAPVLVLGFGLWFSWLRRRTRKGRSS